MVKMGLSDFLNRETILKNIMYILTGSGGVLSDMTPNSITIDGIGKYKAIDMIREKVAISTTVLLCAVDIEYTDFGICIKIRD